MYAWGDNSFGQVGDGTSTKRTSPVALTGALSSGVTAVSAGISHSLAVQGGQVYAWGNNSSGAIGDGTTTQRTSPTLLTAGAAGPLPTDFATVSAGDRTSYALTASHRLFAWGDNSSGQLGLGDSTARLLPTEVFAPSGFQWATLDAGYSHALATLTPVPEPAAVLAVAAGLLGLARVRRAAMALALTRGRRADLPTRP